MHRGFATCNQLLLKYSTCWQEMGIGHLTEPVGKFVRIECCGSFGG